MDENEEEIEEIIPFSLPFDPDDNIFSTHDDEGNEIGPPYSYNDFVKEIMKISGVSEDLLGKE